MIWAKVSRVVLLAMVLLFAASCQPDDPASPSSADPAKQVMANDNAIVIKDDGATSLQVQGMQHHYSREQGLPEVEVGDVLVDYIDGGHIRRVVGVTVSDDSVLIVDTEPGTLADYLHTLNMDTTISIRFGEQTGKGDVRQTQSMVLEPVYMREGVTVANNTLNIDEVTIDTTFGNDFIQLEINGLVNYEPDYIFDLKIVWFNVEEIRVEATGDFVMDLQATATSPALDDAMSGEALLAEFESVVPVAGIPCTLGLAFYVGYEITTNADMEVTSDVSFELFHGAGAQYLNNEWGPIWELDVDAGFTPPELPQIDEVTVRTFIKPELDLEILDVAGPGINVDPGARGDFSLQTDPPALGIDFYADMGANFSFTASLFGYDIADYETQLAFWERLLYSTDDGGIGEMNAAPDAPADPVPTDGADDQPVEVDLAWSCSDPDGDDLTYDLYFGRNPNPQRVAEDLTTPNYDPGTLLEGTTYYWRIVARDVEDAVTEGPLWSFATEGGIGDLIAPELVSYELVPGYPQIPAGAGFTAQYEINNPNPNSVDVNLDARWRRADGAYGELLPYTHEVSLEPGTHVYTRTCTVPDDMQLGVYDFAWYVLWPDNSQITTSGYIDDSFEVVEQGGIYEQDFELGNTGEYVTMVWIAPGTYWMGAQDGEQDAQADEYRRHQVTITEGFWMGKYEVTQEQWEAVMGDWDFHFDGNPTHPAEEVSHNDISNDFLPSINATEPGNPWRLPTEAEWEYACRAGYDETRFWWGDDPWYSELGDYAWYNDNNTPFGTKPVGQKIPNPWGLYDMHGNVWEWCSDWYESDYYDISPPIDPQGPGNGIQRVLRGGSWYGYPQGCRSANRSYSSPTLRYYSRGFRLVRVSPSP